MKHMNSGSTRQMTSKVSYQASNRWQCKMQCMRRQSLLPLRRRRTELVSMV